MERLPLFPLNTVLFPGVALPLHIFEERYQLMIGRCIDERRPFGVVLIKEGVEAGGDAEPHDIGTTAHITHVQRLPEGRLNLVTIGRRRFRILTLDRGEAYLQGDVEELASEDLNAPDVPSLASKAGALFAEELRLSMALSDQWVRGAGLPEEPDALADFVAGQVKWSSEVKQELLATLSLPRRLEREIELLGGRIRELAKRVQEQHRQRYAGAALN